MSTLISTNYSSLVEEYHHYGRREIGSAGIAAIAIFSILAICLCSGAIYLLAKNKNLSDILEDAADDGISCYPCDGVNSQQQYDRGDINSSSGSEFQVYIMYLHVCIYWIFIYYLYLDIWS